MDFDRLFRDLLVYIKHLELRIIELKGAYLSLSRVPEFLGSQQ